MQPATAFAGHRSRLEFGDYRFAGGSAGAATDDGVLAARRATFSVGTTVSPGYLPGIVKDSGPDMQTKQRNG